MKAQTNTPSRSQVTRLSPAQRLARRLVISALSTMTKGNLQIKCSDGNYYNLGAAEPAEHTVIEVRDNRFWLRCVLFGDIGFAESYIDEYWQTDELKKVISWFIINNDNSPVLEDSGKKAFWANLLGSLNRLIYDLRPNSLSGSKSNIEKHYDLSNELFALFLDKSMTYSCAKFLQPQSSLEDAQIEKLDALCRKLNLCSTDNVLEIGSGWGSFAIHAATKYQCHVTTVTISKQQYDYVTAKINALGLTNNIVVLLQDYRQIEGKYNKIVSIEMIEAVGEKYLDTFFSVLHKLLAKDGLLGLQMITCPDSRYPTLSKKVDFVQKHIFPGGLLPSLSRINQATVRTGDLSLFEIEDLGAHYVKTLDAWHERFNAHINQVKALGFDQSFILKWNYYLQYCSAAFATRNVSAVQAIYTRPNNNSLNFIRFQATQETRLRTSSWT